MPGPTWVKNSTAASGFSGTTKTTTFGTNVSTGNSIVVVAITTASVTGVTDQNGNAYTLAATINFVGTYVSIYYSSGVTANNLLAATVTVSSNSLFSVIASEVTGLISLDRTSTGTGTSSNPATGAITTTVANEIIFAAESNGIVGAPMLPSGFTRVYNDTTVFGADSAYQQVFSLQSALNPTWSSSSGNWSAAVASFYTSAAPAIAKYLQSPNTISSSVYNYQLALNNYQSTRDPLPTDDASIDYAPGSVWINKSRQVSWTCVSSVVGAAVWTQGGGSAAIGMLAMDGIDGEDGMIRPGLTGATGATGPQGAPAAMAMDGIDGEEGMPIPAAPVYIATGPIKNIVINPNGEVNQRNTQNVTTTNTVGVTTSAYFADRWKLEVNLATTGTVTAETTNNLPTAITLPDYGKINTCIEVFSATTHSSILAGEYVGISQRIEGFYWKMLHGKPTTLSFWFYTTNGSGLPQTFCASLRDSVGSWSCVRDFTIQSSGGYNWTYVTLSFPAASSGTITYDKTASIILNITFAAGSTYQTATIGSWLSGNFIASTNISNVFTTALQTVAITGIQLEAGSIATPLEHRPFPMELTMCQRYYQKSWGTDVLPGTTRTAGNSPCQFISLATVCAYLGGPVSFNTTMRAAPTMHIYDNSGNIDRMHILISSVWTANQTAYTVIQDSCTNGFYIGANNVANCQGISFDFTADADF